MRFSKVITAGILILTFVYVNSIQNKLLTKLVGIPQNELKSLVAPVAFIFADAPSWPAAPAPPGPAQVKSVDKFPFSIIKNVALPKIIDAIFYPFTEKLTLSNPELPVSGSKANTSIS